MPFIAWNENYSVKVAEIDLQHQGLVNLINTLFDAMKEGKSKQVMGDVIMQLATYAQTHFSTEEQHFDRCGYPLAKVHKREHSDFVAKVTEFKKGFDAGNIALSIELMNFLKDWLLTHILDSDKKYMKCFGEHGIQ